MSMSLRDTPQSVSVITRTQLDDFAVREVNDALELATGISVERVETDRTYYTARGFDIQNFQVDGIGLPLVFGNVEGSLDPAIYDRIEVVRGGTGLMSSLSDPSATINFIRKRPVRDLQASAGLSFGSWNYRRLDADLSVPFNQSGSVRGRLVAAHEDKGSYLDRYQHRKSLFYGVIEADLGASTTLAAGHNAQYNDADSPMWGALPLNDTSGNRTGYRRSTSTATDWAYWDGKKAGSFLELSHFLDNGWQARAVLSHNRTTEDSRLFYVYGTPDPTTPGSDLFSYPSEYEFENRQTLFDVIANGPFSLFGREHELMLGASRARSTSDNTSYYGQGIGTEIPALEDWDGSYPLPAFDAGIDGSRFKDRQNSIYGAVRLNASDRLMLLAGVRRTSYKSDGIAYGEDRTKNYPDRTTPYYGASYRLGETFSLYGSYTKIFRPQTEVDITGSRLDPVTGKSYEAGIKGEFFNRKLNATFALFRARQKNLAEQAGTVPITYYAASDTLSSEGYEFDVSGEAWPGLQLAAGYTFVDIDNADGRDARTFIPRRSARLAVTYRLPSMQAMKVGASIKWQDDIHRINGTASTGSRAGEDIRVRQKSYALINLMARYEFSKHLSATLNLNNLTDEKYINSLYWEQGFYGAPRNLNVALNWTY
ncbi:TonB-dependent siderophore receptor [Noviherbaspirillum aridicola]|uniref:Ligand-gated channel protein n=1 Tax=Noviherbaspirillum aridicola TaxID=2849687 RepID=A0ABQ4QB57_9BURK|nr:TonB-dependent siderophore receptor [Noviherbaspirillum aridicola]GIZ54025.1 ligand-gated channel protein [Noviherbaspirillum aridicola]